MRNKKEPDGKPSAGGRSKRDSDMINKFRRKMLLLFAAIIGLSAAITLSSYLGIGALYSSAVRAGMVKPGGVLYIARELTGFVGDFYVFLVLFTLTFLVLFWIITMKYAKPLADVSRGISSISKGNFDVDIKVKSNDEIAALANDVNEAAKKLKAAVATGAFAEKSKDRLVVSVAHDLRTPLTSITGYLGLIVGDRALPDDKVRHYAEIAYNKSKRLDTLIDDLFELSKFQYGRVEINRKIIDLSYLIEQINEEFMPLMAENGVETRLYIARRPVYVEADGPLIARALENLINNAVKYGREGKYIDVQLFTGEGSAFVQVINYGSYIPDEEQQLIFETFYRTDKSRSEAEGGTGLGLAIVKSIVEAHGGSVCVESTIERTIFEMEIPCPDGEVRDKEGLDAPGEK